MVRRSQEEMAEGTIRQRYALADAAQRIAISRRARRREPRSFCRLEILLQVIRVVGSAHDELAGIEAKKIPDLTNVELAVTECDERQIAAPDARERSARTDSRPRARSANRAARNWRKVNASAPSAERQVPT